MTKNPKLQLCRQHFLLEALSIHQPPNVVVPKEHASAQLQFWIFLFFFYLQNCTRIETFVYCANKCCIIIIIRRKHFDGQLVFVLTRFYCNPFKTSYFDIISNIFVTEFGNLPNRRVAVRMGIPTGFPYEWEWELI